MPPGEAREPVVAQQSCEMFQMNNLRKGKGLTHNTCTIVSISTKLNGLNYCGFLEVVHSGCTSLCTKTSKRSHQLQFYEDISAQSQVRQLEFNCQSALMIYFL